MPNYEVTRFETHKVTYQVEADSELDAIERVLEGTAEIVQDSAEFIESGHISNVEEV